MGFLNSLLLHILPFRRRLSACRRGLRQWPRDGKIADRVRLFALWITPSKLGYRTQSDQDTGPFAAIWDEQTAGRARRLLERVMHVAQSLDIPLYLYWGTLLGQVRQGRILPWDDDVDLALFNPGHVKRLELALIRAGLRIHEQEDGNDFWIKVFDPNFPVTTSYGWTYPFLDIFVYAFLGSGPATTCSGIRVASTDIEPGRIVMFEGVRCLEPRRPMALLDRHYPGWRTQEQTASWDHRTETRRQIQHTRPISIGWTGRRKASGDATSLDATSVKELN